LIYALKKIFQLKKTPIIIDIIFTFRRKRSPQEIVGFFFKFTVT